MEFKILFFFLQLILPLAIGQDSEPSIPSNMPAPPKPPTAATAPGPNGARAPGGGRGPEAANAALPGNTLPNPPPQNAPPGGPAETPPPPTPVIFGLNHIILILVPQFKTTIPHLPKWAGANAKVSVPITVFFDKLKVPEPPPQGPYPPSPFYGPLFPEGHYVQRRKRSVEQLLEHNRLRSRRGPSLAEPTDWDRQGPNHQYLDGKQSSLISQAAFRAERLTLLPKLEKLLESFGLGGKSCLLRTICETHDFPLEDHGYGLAGELFTLFFSVSRSAFANSHLSEYLEAENVGKTGDCGRYFEGCTSSLFFWEKIAHANETEIEDEELELLNQLF